MPPTISVGRYGAGCQNTEPDNFNPIARCSEQRAFFFASKAVSDTAFEAPQCMSIGGACYGYA